jgi:hypothetical protein
MPAPSYRKKHDRCRLGPMGVVANELSWSEAELTTNTMMKCNFDATFLKHNERSTWG